MAKVRSWRDPTPFGQFYNIPEAETVVRGTLIYLGFHEFIKGLVDLYWLDSSLTWADVMKKRLVLGILERSKSCLVNPIDFHISYRLGTLVSRV